MQSATQANCHLLAVPRFRLNTYGRRAFSVAGPMAWNSLQDFIWDPTGLTGADLLLAVLGVYLKRTCLRVTSASSALRVLNDYALHKSTHSLTHSKQNVKWELAKCQNLQAYFTLVYSTVTIFYPPTSSLMLTVNFTWKFTTCRCCHFCSHWGFLATRWCSGLCVLISFPKYACKCCLLCWRLGFLRSFDHWFCIKAVQNIRKISFPKCIHCRNFTLVR